MTKFTFVSAIAALMTISAVAQDRLVVPQESANGARIQTNQRTVSHQNQIVARGGVSAINVAYSDDFSQPNDTTSLKARGYLPYYRGTGPQGVGATWFQGNPTVFAAYNGAADAYVAANYQVVTNMNDIDSWLVTPAMNISAGDVISFYCRTQAGSIWPDSVRVMYSAAGDSTPEGLTWVELGRFQAYDQAWEQKIYTVAASGATARFAIRYAVIEGGPNGNNSNFIGIDQLDIYTPQAVDGQLYAMDNIPSGCGLSATTPVTVTLKNNGGSAISGFSVGFMVDNGTPVNETFTGSIASNATASYTFTGTADLSAPGAHTVTAFITLPSDGNPLNDTLSTSVTNIAPAVITTTAYTEGFESTVVGATPPVGWTTEDTDGDGANWDFSNALPNNGTMCARIGFAGSAVSNAENWLITPCLDLTAGTNYVLEYWYKSYDDTQTSYELESRFGNAAVGSAMTNNIAVDPLYADSSYHLASHTFTVPSSGVYYVGFNGFGAAPQVSLRLDDASLAVSTGINDNTIENKVSVYPNPASDFLYVTAKLKGQSTLVIYNNLGQEVMKYSYNEPFKVQLDVQSLAKGVYTVKINNADGVVINKFVKQ